MSSCFLFAQLLLKAGSIALFAKQVLADDYKLIPGIVLALNSLGSFSMN
jgi:hypothetical protein